MALFQCIDYGEAREILPGVTVTFTDAGHILGSAVVNLVIDDGSRVMHLTFSGDVGRYVDRLIPDPAPFPQCDVLICESTYGDRDHPPIAEANDALLAHVQRVCVDQKGKLMIPAFSIGKTQEVLHALNTLSNEGRLPRIPVFVDSPLAIGATEISHTHAKLFRASVREELRRDPDLFNFPGVSFVRAPAQSKALNHREGPCIIIAASGMMEAGRIRHHLRHGLPDPRNGVLVVGFCAPGTLGDDLLNGAQEVHIHGDPVAVRASIRRMDFFSAHADRSELLRWVGCQDPRKVRRAFMVHGVPAALTALRANLQDKGFTSVEIPRLGQRFEI